MPIYCYTCRKCGKTIEKAFRMVDRKQYVQCDCGHNAYRDIVKEQMSSDPCPVKDFHIESFATAVLPEQVEQVRELERRHGLNLEYDRFGQVHYRNRSEMRKHLKMLGLFDKDAYY